LIEIKKFLHLLKKNHQNQISKLYSNCRIEELQPIEEAQNSILKGIENDETGLLELATLQKTQLLRCAKIIKGQRRKLCDFETERAELELQLSERGSLISTLEEKVKSSQFQLENIQKQLKTSEDGKRQLETQVQSLQTRVDQSEALIGLRRNEMSNLLRLVTEVEISISEMNKLVFYCQSLSSGEEPPLDAVLGLDFEVDGDELSHQDESESDCDKLEFDVDLEWILERLKLVREVRNQIRKLRSEVNEIYTDILSSGTGCGIQ